ncbi:hypothetical protein L3X07_11135 [Levilactobacillus brevis]|nr:hypothetical protein [Levilactobacillus brevis]
MITVQDYYEPTQPTLLFSLHPEPAQAIEAGTKRIEYRRRFYHQGPFQAFVHVTGTHGGIGLFLQISQPLVAAPNHLLANLTALMLPPFATISAMFPRLLHCRSEL